MVRELYKYLQNCRVLSGKIPKKHNPSWAVRQERSCPLKKYKRVLVSRDHKNVVGPIISVLAVCVCHFTTQPILNALETKIRHDTVTEPWVTRSINS